jgi:hypothetical protein
MGKVLDKIKEIGGYVLVGLLAVFAIVKWLMGRKETVKDALIKDAPKKAAAEVAEAKAEDAKQDADELGKKADNVEENESWEKSRKKF